MNKIYNDNYELYYDKDLIVCPLLGKSPHICGKDWQKKSFNKEQNKGNNIGLLTGERSGVICVDIDTTDEFLKKKIYSFLPPIYSGKIGNKNKGNNYFFKFNGEINKKINGVVEILSTGNMTVLPPSVHPDLNYEYEWIGKSLLDIDIDELPDLPKDFIDNVLSITKPSESFSNEGRHNKLIEIAGGKIGDGVDPTTAIQELIEYDELHHSPPYFTDKTELHKGKGYETAFNLYMSVAKTAQQKGAFVKPSSTTVTIGEIKEYKKDFKKLPKLIGIGQKIFNDLYDNSPIPRTQLCFMNTLNILSIIIGNKLYHRGTACNLYQYGIAPTGYGKDFSFKRAKQILIDSGLENLIGSTSPTSESVVLATLEKNREKVMFINEAESLLKRINDDRKNNGLRECLTDLYDYGGKMHSPKHTMSLTRRNGETTDQIGHVFSPFVNILMTSTTAAFEKHASDDIFNTGFGSRFLFYFEDRFKDQKFIEDYSPPINQNLIKAIKLIAENSNVAFDLTSTKNVFEIDHAVISEEANICYKDIFSELQKEKRIYKDDNFLGLISRKLYFINKLTTIHHVMKNPTNFVSELIMPDSYEWAKLAVDSIVHNMMQNLNDTVSNSYYGSTYNKFLKYIKDRTEQKNPPTLREISNRFRGITPLDRKKVLADLIESGNVVLDESKKYKCVMN